MNNAKEIMILVLEVRIHHVGVIIEVKQARTIKVGA